jgi:hypothetical protein
VKLVVVRCYCENRINEDILNQLREREKDDNGRGQQIHKIHTNNCMDL